MLECRSYYVALTLILQSSHISAFLATATALVWRRNNSLCALSGRVSCAIRDWASYTLELRDSPRISDIDERARQDYTQPVLARDDESGPLRQKIPNRVRA